MDKTGKQNQTNEGSTQNCSSEHMHSDESTEPFCRITWSEIFEDTLKRYADSIPCDIKSLYNPVTSRNNSKMSENLDALHKQLKFQFQILIDQYKLVQAEHVKMLEKNENLRIVNKKILDRLQAITPKNKRKTIDRETQTQDTLEFSKENISCIEDSYTQTSNESSVIQSAFSVAPSKTSEESKSMGECFGNDNNKEYDSKADKLTKIIIYRIPEELGIPDIMRAICDTIQCPSNSIIFEKKHKLKTSGMHNYVFEVPHKIACHLIKNKNIQIKTQSFPVREFIRVIRCFSCQAFNHFADSCKNGKICARCGDPHDSFNCHRTPRCINCIINNRTNKNFATDHPAFSLECESLKYYIKEQRRFLDILN